MFGSDSDGEPELMPLPIMAGRRYVLQAEPGAVRVKPKEPGQRFTIRMSGGKVHVFAERDDEVDWLVQHGGRVLPRAPRPPGLATRLLSCRLSGKFGREMLGDLLEEYPEVVSTHGQTRARLWFFSQALRTVGASALTRSAAAVESIKRLIS
jgi:hypothetical protein